MFMRSSQGRDDITPSLIDLERTHIVFVNAHFKPFAAIGYEYNKVKPQSGNTMLGSGVTFSIPQFGDFFHDMVCRVRIGQAYGAIGTIPSQTASTDQQTSIFPSNTVAAATGNIAYSYNIVDFKGNRLVTGIAGAQAVTATYRNLVRYCEFPGNRLFTKVKFDVNGNPLDEYDQYVPVMLEKFTVLPNKRTGYNTLNGQQNELKGLGSLNARNVYDADNLTPGFNQYAASGITPATVANGVAGLTYNTPSGITSNATGQSNQTVDLFTPVVATGTASVFQIAAPFGWSYTGPSIPVVNTHSQASMALATASTALPATTFDNFSSASTASSQNIPTDSQQYDVSQKVSAYVNGPQTPKPVQNALEIWNKLKFWFNDDVKLSIPSVSIPYGQRFITIELNSASNLLYEVPSIYLETICSVEVTTKTGLTATALTGVTISTFGALASAATDLTSAGPLISADSEITLASVPLAPSGVLSFTGVTGLTPATSYTYRSYTPILQKFGVNTPAVQAMELYINNIFVNPEVHDIFIKRIGFALIRVYRQQQSTVNTAGTTELLLSSLKWPIEYMFVGVQPVWNQKDTTTSGGVVTSGNVNVWRDWHRMTRTVEVTADTPDLASNAYSGSTVGQITPDKYFIPVSTVDSLSVTSHGITIFDNFQDTFFTAYAPYHYGETTLVTPEDTGAFFINMCLFPRSYQPSGHLNISRARETYIKFQSSYVSSKTPCIVIVIAIAINFILISDGSAVLRYST